MSEGSNGKRVRRAVTIAHGGLSPELVILLFTLVAFCAGVVVVSIGALSHVESVSVAGGLNEDSRLLLDRIESMVASATHISMASVPGGGITMVGDFAGTGGDPANDHRQIRLCRASNNPRELQVQLIEEGQVINVRTISDLLEPGDGFPIILEGASGDDYLPIEDCSTDGPASQNGDYSTDMIRITVSLAGHGHSKSYTRIVTLEEPVTIRNL